MKIINMEIKELTSQRGQCILTITTDVDIVGKPSNAGHPAVMQQFPTAVAEELVRCWEAKKDAGIIEHNVKECSFCRGPVDRYETCFQCRHCLAFGDLNTGIMVEMEKI